jgi:hypothetical protein
MMRHTYTIRATLRQAGWLPFVGSRDARTGVAWDLVGGDRA